MDDVVVAHAYAEAAESPILSETEVRSSCLHCAGCTRSLALRTRRSTHGGSEQEQTSKSPLPRRIHLLDHHMGRPLPHGRGWVASVVRTTSPTRLRGRLALFAASHDIGKVNVGFPTEIWKSQPYRADPPGGVLPHA